MSDDLKQVGHGLRAGYEPGGNLIIECLWPESLIRGARVIVQRADVPDLLRAIMGGEDYERTVAPRMLANLKAIRDGQERAAEPATWVASDRAGGPPAGLASPAALEMAGTAPTRAGALHDAMTIAFGHGNQDPPATADPAALLRAAIAKAAPRAYCDPAGLLTLAQAMESVNRAPPVAPSPMQYPDLNHIELVRLRRVVAKVEALRDKWRSTGGISTTDIERALRGEDPSDG